MSEKTSTPIFSLAIVGTIDFVRRMEAVTSREFQNSSFRILTGNLSELKSIILSERPNLVLFDVGFKTAKSDIEWIRSSLSLLRSRLGRSTSTCLAVTSAKKFALAGSLLFANEASLEPSEIIDHMIISPPSNTPNAPRIETQILDCIHRYQEFLELSEEHNFSLPALWEKNWIPAMSDPKNRAIWLRWLPRYARYIQENPLIVGPTGSGKTRLAEALHSMSGRSGPFISITPRDFSSTELVQAELFGAVEGAYTGAVEKWGLVKRAEKGTLFIDELQSIDHDLQGKLITFIESKSYRRVGEAESHAADVRFIFATNRPLEQLVAEKALRDDFAYRLERIQLTLPALEERRLDIAAGSIFAMSKVIRERSRTSSMEIQGFTGGAYQKLFSSSWPGNLRQLENSVAKLLELANIRKTSLVDEDAVIETLETMLGHSEASFSEVLESGAQMALHEAKLGRIDSMSQFITCVSDSTRVAALDRTGGNIEEAAELVQDSAKAMELFATTRS